MLDQALLRARPSWSQTRSCKPPSGIWSGKQRIRGAVNDRIGIEPKS